MGTPVDSGFYTVRLCKLSDCTCRPANSAPATSHFRALGARAGPDFRAVLVGDAASAHRQPTRASTPWVLVPIFVAACANGAAVRPKYTPQRMGPTPDSSDARGMLKTRTIQSRRAGGAVVQQALAVAMI